MSVSEIRKEWERAASAWNRSAATDHKTIIQLGEDLYFAGLAAVDALEAARKASDQSKEGTGE